MKQDILKLKKATRPLKGEIQLPGDKSLAHRAALFAAIAEGDSCIENFPDTGVSRSMRNALHSLGIADSLANGRLTVHGNGLRPFPASDVTAYCGNSATTMRLLAGVLAATGTSATLDGSSGLRLRPMGRILEPLRKMGVGVSAAAGPKGESAPLTFTTSKNKTKAFTGSIPVASAQVKSCIILAALNGDGVSKIKEPGPSRDHTERMLSSMGADVTYDAALMEATVSPLDRPLAPLNGELPGDISSAAFLFAAAAITPGSEITVRRICLNPTRTGIIDILSAMGVKIDISNKTTVFGEIAGDVTISYTPLKSTNISGDLIVRSIDELPAITAVAAFADGVTTVKDAMELRHKESDRIAQLVKQFRALGAEIDETADGFSIRGNTIKGGTAASAGDHRIAMSAALCGLVKDVSVEGAGIINESFPGFADTLYSLY